MMSAGTAAAAVICILGLVSLSKVPSHVGALPGIDANEHQVANVTPILLDESLLSKEYVRCARFPVSGLSRINIWSYSSARRLNLVPSDEIQQKAYKKIHICFHSNASLALCQCESDMWASLHGGSWSSVISPYEDKYIDVKFVDNLSGFVTVTTALEFQRWRLIFLSIGLGLLLLAPIVSSWVPFYYSSSMAIGICLVVIVLLFQVMKLLPTARKNALYSTLSAVALGAGSFLLNRASMIVNSMLVNLGINNEMHNPVLVFSLVAIVLGGAGFGYWLVRKFVVTDDGSVDANVSQFVKWALRVIAVTCILQSTLDTLFALLLLASLLVLNFTLTHLELGYWWKFMHSVNWSPLHRRTPRRNQGKLNAEFLSKPKGNLWRSPGRSPLWSKSPMRGDVTPLNHRRATPSSTEYYSTFHKTPRKRFTDEEWEDFTNEYTRNAVSV